MNKFDTRQSGAVLPVCLFILVIVTLLVVSSARTTNTGLQIVFAQQSQLTAEMTALQRSEQMLGDSRWFIAGGGAGTFQEIVDEAEDAPGAVDTDEVHESMLNGLVVSVQKPRCIGYAPVLGYSTQVQFPPERAYWESTIEVVDPVTNARSVLTQGTRMRMPFDSCRPL